MITSLFTHSTFTVLTPVGVVKTPARNLRFPVSSCSADMEHFVQRSQLVSDIPLKSICFPSSQKYSGIVTRVGVSKKSCWIFHNLLLFS